MHTKQFWRNSAATLLCLMATTGCARSDTREAAPKSWTFAVAGDSRNCGNMVMPAIATGAQQAGAAFYWHLGDLRSVYKVDEDFAKEQRFQRFLPPPSVGDYLSSAWDDFRQHQIAPFGDMPFFLGIGNHETIAPKTRNQFRIAFASLLDRPEIHAQRERDSQATTGIPSTAPDQTYYHWRIRGVDFINLDNAVGDTFDDAQLAWLDAVLAADQSDSTVHSVVVGMHEALPYSRSDNHSMCADADGLRSGLHVYTRLADLQKVKPVYVLASHSHYYLANIFDTPHWNEASVHVLPGWVIGTAGAERYALPGGVAQGPDAREHVYGYLVGSVDARGRIVFSFRELGEADLQRSRSNDYAEDSVTFCIENNPPLEKLAKANRSDDHSCDRKAAP